MWLPLVGRAWKLAKMVRNTQRIDAIKRYLGELDSLKERFNDLTSAREGFDLARLLNKFKQLESAIQLLVQ